jgi:hypothetical protein
MRTTLRLALTTLALGLVATGACKKKDGDGAASSGDKVADDNPAAPAIAVNDADWVAKDLKTVSPMVNLTMKVPKDGKLEKNGNGGVDIRVADPYILTVSTLAVSSVAEAMKGDKSLGVDAKDKYINTKIVSEEPNGFIYTIQMKDEANGTKYEPETHFAVYVEKDGAFYSITDQRPLDHFDAPGSTYSEALAKKVYGIVKGSAKAN